MITIGHYLTVAVQRFPLSPWGEGWGEGAVVNLSVPETAPSPGADVMSMQSSAFNGRAGLSPRGEAKQERSE
jgi:hypothetical protein